MRGGTVETTERVCGGARGEVPAALVGALQADALAGVETHDERRIATSGARLGESVAADGKRRG
jgi:hypothetical protein